MKRARDRMAAAWRVARSPIIAAAFTLVVVLLMLWLAGVLHRKVGAVAGGAVEPGPPGDARLAAVRTIRLPRYEYSVGTFRAVHETSVASKLLAKVMEVNVRAGQAVRRDEVLVRLDDQDLRARLDQAAASGEAAGAARDHAEVELRRIERLFEQKMAADIELERGRTALRTAEAELHRAEQARHEAETILEYATIRSPMDGVVIDKQVEVGDTVTPGQTLLKLFDPTRMQLVASVRESLTQRLTVGQTIGVHVEALAKTCEGQVSEIVPEAHAASRTFSVKVTGPCPPGVYSGMFGRLMVPLGEEEVVVAPAAAVRRVGQLDIVDVMESGRLRRRAVQLGRTIGADLEVLSGLRPGEQVVVHAGGPA